MPDKKSKLESIEKRLERLEYIHDSDGPTGEEPGQLYCAVPPTEPRVFDASVSRDRREAIIEIGSKWTNGTVLHYHMFSSGVSSSPATKRGCPSRISKRTMTVSEPPKVRML